MALMSCPECGKEFSDQAQACPNCAWPNPQVQPTAASAPAAKKVGCGTYVLGGLGLLFALLVMRGISSTEATTPSSAANDQPAAAEQAETKEQAPARAPEPAPFVVKGRNENVSKKFTLQPGIAVFQMDYDGSSNFMVDLLDADGQQIADLVNEIDAFHGSQAAKVEGGTYFFKVVSSASWAIKVTQPRPGSAPATTSFSGKGMKVVGPFSMGGGLKTIALTHDGRRNFIVDLLDTAGEDVSDLQNVIGRANNSTPVTTDGGIFFLNVTADGHWTISIN